MKKETLYEVADYDIDPNQQQIADSGSDVNADVSDPALEGQGPDMDQVPEGMDDMDYMGEEPMEAQDMVDPNVQMEMPGEAPQPPNSQANSADALKIMHLFDLSTTLFDYTEIVERNLKDIDQTKLATETIAYLSQLFGFMTRFKSKVRDFIAEVFPKETYEKNLYTYLVLRHELLSIIKCMRSLLNLETLEIDEDELKVDKSKTQNRTLQRKTK